MKTVLRWLAALTIPFLLTTAAVAKDYREGDGYTVLANPQPTSSGEKIEVLELFWYGCPHCYDLEPYIRKWLDGKPDDVVFVRLPAIVGPRWELLARAYFTAELLGVLDKVHPALFDAIHAEHREINDEGALEAFFVEQGVAAEDFRGTFNSFAVAVKTNTAKMKTRQYAITGVPTVIVNGKYSTSGRQAGSNQGIIDVVRYLIKQERSTGKADAG
ncbi:MAG: thiol:disulfide interchange protein DsbA/DsbL [Gammaproteobacteria bacterium]|jgi:thiol:disulfide interchange protein DsbA